MRMFPCSTATVISLGISATLLCACGGGNDGAGLPPLDIAGVWTADETATGGAQGLMLTVGDVAYGFETRGTTLRYFKGSGYSADSVDYSFNASRYDETTGGSAHASASVNGKLQGKFIEGTTPRQLFLTYAHVGTGSFDPMRMSPAPATVSAVADLRNFAVRFSLPAGNLTITPQSASTGALQGTGVNGCSISGSLSLPRADRNVWAVRWTQSACIDSSRNNLSTTGLALIYQAGNTRNITVVGEDGRAWTLVSSSIQ